MSWLDDQGFFHAGLFVLRVLSSHQPWGSVCESVDTVCVFKKKKVKAEGFGYSGWFDAENESIKTHLLAYVVLQQLSKFHWES